MSPLNDRRALVQTDLIMSDPRATMTDDLHQTHAACPDALRREQAHLHEELSRATADAAERERELERQEVRLSSSRTRLDALAGAGRRLPLLDRARIASPCPMPWEQMVGDERTRYCRKCSKTVYNLSEMSRPEAEALLLASGVSTCVRFYRRKDGTIMTADCHAGWRRRRLKAVAALALSAIAGAAASDLLNPDTVEYAAGAVSFDHPEVDTTARGDR